MPHLDDEQLESLLRQSKPDLPSFSPQKKRQLRAKLLAQASQNNSQTRPTVVWQRALGVAGALMLFILPAYFWLVQVTAQNGGTIASFIPFGPWESEEPTAVSPTSTPLPDTFITDEVLGPPRLAPSLTEQAYPPPLLPSHAHGYPPPTAIGQTADIWFKGLSVEEKIISVELSYQLSGDPERAEALSTTGYIELTSTWGTNGRYTAQYPIDQMASTISVKMDMSSWQVGQPITINADLFYGREGDERVVATAVPYRTQPDQQIWVQKERALEQTAEGYAVELLFGYQYPNNNASVEFQLKAGQTIIARQTETSPMGLIHLSLLLPKTYVDTLLVGELYAQTATGELVFLEAVSWSLQH